MIDFAIKANNGVTSILANNYDFNKWIAWLERQGTKLPVGFYYVNSDGKKFYSDTLKYGDVILHVENQSKQKREWSEEDETTRNTLINLVEMYYGGCIDKTEKNRLLNFLKSLRPQNR